MSQMLRQEVEKDVGRVKECFLGPDLILSEADLNVA